jgi:hypothetical protein
VTTDDGRIITDIVIASLLASGLRLIVQKAFLEPAAAWAGQTGLKKAWQLVRCALERKPEQSR